MNNSDKYTKDVVGTIRISLVSSFSLLFVSGAILLFVTRSDNSVFYIQTAILAGCYIVLLILLSRFLTKRVKKSFEPVIQLSESLKESNIKNDSLKKELNLAMDTISMNEDENIKKDALLDSSREQLRNILTSYESLRKKYLNLLSREKEILIEIGISSQNVIENKDNILNLNDSANKYLNQLQTVEADFLIDYKDIEKAYNVIKNMLSDSLDCFDMVFSDITNLQSITSQINLYAMNLSLECSRCGVLNLNISTAIDDIINMTKKISDVSDTVSLNTIKLKNSAKLAFDQALFCDEQCSEGIKEFEDAKVKTEKLSSKMNKIEQFSDDFINGYNGVNRLINELNNINSDFSKLDADIEKQNSLVNDFIDMLI